MTTAVRFQVPGNGGAVLLQSLTDASSTATGGGGVFAWATSSGIESLIKNPDFQMFLEKRPFTLFVGTDSITDSKALDTMKKATVDFPKLSIQAVINDARGLFHPKLAWFVLPTGVRLIVGSGNLTRGGLFGNWEAFTDSTLPLEDLEDLEEAIRDWLETTSPGPLPLDDPRVSARVALNSGDERTVKIPTIALPPVVSTPADVDGWLIAELNKSRKDAVTGASMFSQASFDQDNFQRFFDYAGAPVPIVLNPVRSDGQLGVLESRKGRFKANSVNYYFELGSVQGLPYPSVGRPTAVFGRLAVGGYIYRVFLPGETGHAELEAWLKTNAPAKAITSMRRKRVSTEELRRAWPANPLLKANIPGS